MIPIHRTPGPTSGTRANLRLSLFASTLVIVAAASAQPVPAPEKTAGTDPATESPTTSAAAGAAPASVGQALMPRIDDSLESEAQAREALMRDVRAYQRAIAELESRDGAFSPELGEQLLGLGLALQRNGDHESAIAVFKRGVHVARVTDGLYSERQLALLQGEIASHVALGAYTEADERQRYLYRVQARTLSDRNRGQALMQHALWQRQAYEAGLGEEPFNRLTRMWSLYRLALTELVETEGEDSPALMPPLLGMLRSQYLLSGFVGETTTGRFRTSGVYPDEASMQVAYRTQSYKQGSAVIRAIYDVRVAQPDASFIDSVDSMIMLADWKFWHGKRAGALETYAKLYEELAAQEDAEVVLKAVFDEPQPLPNIAGVRALPAPDAEGPDSLLLEFSVNERGRVTDLERLDEHPQFDEKAEEIARRIRQTLFRPRFSDGMPVPTDKVRWAYDISHW